MKHVHLIGIGGTGMSAIARVLLEMGYQVSGSDQHASSYFDALQQAGANTYLGHAADNVWGADLVIRSSAVRDDNPEVVAAKATGIPVLKRADVLELLMLNQLPLAVAGTHGKTTTTAMLICMLESMGQDPSYIIGALIKQLNANAKAGKGAYFVIEADEYDYMFLGLNPWVSVVTNIEHDHPDCFPTFEIYRQAFKDFLDRTRKNGSALLCLDDPGLKALLPELSTRDYQVLTYGLDKAADYQAHNLHVNKQNCPTFDLVFKTKEGLLLELGCCSLQIPGDHNVLNALAALAVIHRLGLPMDKALAGLAAFQGTERRFDVAAEIDGVVIINDYAHHPTQIRTTLQAARQRYPNSQLWVVWEPHTYSRPAALAPDFIEVLNQADQVIITQVYAAREVDNGYTPKPIAEALSSGKGQYIPDFTDVVTHLVDRLGQQDVVLVLSAGNAPQISALLQKALEKERKAANQADGNDLNED